MPILRLGLLVPVLLVGCVSAPGIDRGPADVVTIVPAAFVTAQEDPPAGDPAEPDPGPPSWSTTELQLQVGDLDRPGFAGGGSEVTTIVTLQHAASWRYGDHFLFADFITSKKTGDGFDNDDVYAEWYPQMSLGAVTGKSFAFGPVRDVGVIAGVNFGADSNVVKYLPGVRFALDLPGFAFANLDVTAYIDDSSGTRRGGAPKEEDSFMVDFNWAYPIALGEHSLSIEGHAEYIGERDDELGNTVEGHILAQPQLRYDLGKALFDAPGECFIGIEAQFWMNKLGDEDTDETAVQALLVLRL